MSFKVNTVEYKCWPNELAVEDALNSLSLSISKLTSSLQSFVHEDMQIPGRGLQQDIAKSLERHFENTLLSDGIVSSSSRYSRELKEVADFTIGRSYSGKRVFFEIEFRPNVEKDLIKFQIGAKAETLVVGILILPITRENINRHYTTMPEYRKFVHLIDQLTPSHPLLLLGFDGVSE